MKSWALIFLLSGVSCLPVFQLISYSDLSSSLRSPPAPVFRQSIIPRRPSIPTPTPGDGAKYTIQISPLQGAYSVFFGAGSPANIVAYPAPAPPAPALPKIFQPIDFEYEEEIREEKPVSIEFDEEIREEDPAFEYEEEIREEKPVSIEDDEEMREEDPVSIEDDEKIKPVVVIKDNQVDPVEEEVATEVAAVGDYTEKLEIIEESVNDVKNELDGETKTQ